MQPDKMIPRARTIQVAEQEPDNNEAGQTAGNKGDKEPPPRAWWLTLRPITVREPVTGMKAF